MLCDAIATFKKFIRVKTIITDTRIKRKTGEVAAAQQKDCGQLFSNLRLKLQKNTMLMHDIKRWMKDLDALDCVNAHAMHLKNMKKLLENAAKIIKEMDLNFCSDRKFEIEFYVNHSVDCSM